MSGLPAKPINLMLVCGEPSGDLLGAQLMTGLKAVTGGNVHFTGVGGSAMAALGLRSLYSLDATAVMGLREVVPAIPAILARVRTASEFALETRPDAIVLIDSPDFTHRIARRIKELDASLRTINYVAPQVWASRAYRAKKMAKYFDLVLALLPFEVPFFDKYGLKAEFVGHPVIERQARMTGGDELRRKLGIAPDAPLLCALPGSRRNEIRFILPAFRDAAAALAKQVPALVCVLPTVPHVAERVRQAAVDWPTPLHVLDSEDEKYSAFDAADAAIAASGTVTTELALSRTPMVVVYKMGWVTYVLTKPLFRLKYFTLVNLLLDRSVAPELLQGGATGKTIAEAVLPLLTDKAAAARQVAGLDEAIARLGQGGEAPSLRAARAIVDFVQNKRRLEIST